MHGRVNTGENKRKEIITVRVNVRSVEGHNTEGFISKCKVTRDKEAICVTGRTNQGEDRFVQDGRPPRMVRARKLNPEIAFGIE